MMVYIFFKNVIYKKKVHFRDPGSVPKHSSNYFRQIFTSFKSTVFIENLLSLLRNFGFLNFCLETSLLDSYLDSLLSSGESALDYYRDRNACPELAFSWEISSDRINRERCYGVQDFWWRGYSPYDIDHSDDFEALLDAFFVFENDTRFSTHLACFAKIFDVNSNILYRDFKNMKDLKASKSSMVIRKGKYFNETFSLRFPENFNYFNTRSDHGVIKVFQAAVYKVIGTFQGVPTCGNLPDTGELFSYFLFDELFKEAHRIINDSRIEFRTGVVKPEADQDPSGRSGQNWDPLTPTPSPWFAALHFPFISF